MVGAWVRAAAAVLWLGGCASAAQGDGYDTARLPEALRGDYAVFAQRCSKCHSLARPLGSGVDDDGFWRMYVEQMRLKPGSGISVADEAPILRFLHYYSVEQRRHRTPSPPPAPVAPTVAPPPLAGGKEQE
jgi:hypothetical protein